MTSFEFKNYTFFNRNHFFQHQYTLKLFEYIDILDYKPKITLINPYYYH